MNLALAALAFALLDASQTEQATGDSFAEGLVAARRNLESKKGGEYGRQVGRDLANVVRARLTEGMKGSPAEVSRVQVVMRLQADGTVSQAIAYPKTEASTRAVLRLPGSRVTPVPPAPDFWILAEVESARGMPAVSRGRPGPMPQGRFFRLRSSEAWSLVQKGLPQLGLAAGKTDRLNQVVLTKWRDFGAKGMDWLPAPALPSGYAASRHRFEVFVSPFAEPARVYVGSVVEVRRLGDVESRGAVYNSPTVNAALMTQIARAIGEEGVPIPSDHDQRRLVALSILGDEANECLRRGTTAAARIDRLTPPSEIAVSRFEIEYPEAASTRGEGTVEIEFAIQEDGAISDVHVPGPPSDYQFDLSAMGPVSLRLYSPARTDGCPIPVSMSYTVNYKRAP